MADWRRLIALGTLGGLAVAAVLALGGCDEGEKGEDRPNVDVIGGGGSASASNSGAVEGYGEPLYFPSSDQDANLAIGQDLADMRALMAAAVRGESVDWAAVSRIYAEGKNQLAGGGVRSLASLAARHPELDAAIHDGLTGTGKAAGRTENARRQMVDKGVQGVMYREAMQALAEAESAGLGAGGEAARLVDQAWATLSGARDPNTQSPNNGLLATGLGREEDFQFQGRLSRPLEAALFRALGAAERGDRAALTSALGSSRGLLNTIMYHSVLRYAKVLEQDQRTSDRDFHLAEAATFFLALKPQVERASTAAAAAVEDAYARPADQEFPSAATTAVYSAMNEATVLRALGIPEEFQVRDP